MLGGAGEDFGSVTQAVAGISEQPVQQTNKAWVAAFMVSLTLLLMLGAMLFHLITTGVGVWGNNNPVYWGWPIVNFVFWVGIGHAGTLISAILFLTRQNWRTSMNRAAEAMRRSSRRLRRHVPGRSHRPGVGGLLAVPAAQPDGHVAELPQPAAVGRVRGLDLRLGVAGLLVHRHDPGPRDAAGPGEQQHPQDRLRHLRHGLDGFVPPLAPLRAAYLLLAALAAPPWCSRCTRWFRSTSPCRSSPAGTPRSSRPTSSRARCSAASPWCSPHGARPPVLRARAHHHDESHRRDGAS